MSLLIATSKYYDFLHVAHFLIPLGVLNLALIALDVYLKESSEKDGPLGYDDAYKLDAALF
jgi:hypothetical protein